MRFVDTGDPGTVVVAQDHLGRYAEFEESLERLQVPVDTKLWRVRSGACAMNCNVGVSKRTGGWVWFIDDDHTFEPNVLLRLLSHEKELVAPLVPMRYPPFDFVMYKKLDIIEHQDRTTCASVFYTMPDLDGVSGLIPVQGLPKSGCLMRERVWKTMPPPWFKMGRIQPDQIDDDRYFMWEARSKYGFELWCDTDQVITHITTVSIGCRRDEQRRCVRTAGIHGAVLDI